jgi:hypothetical protein
MAKAADRGARHDKSSEAYLYRPPVYREWLDEQEQSK